MWTEVIHFSLMENGMLTVLAIAVINLSKNINKNLIVIFKNLKIFLDTRTFFGDDSFK